VTVVVEKRKSGTYRVKLKEKNPLTKKWETVAQATGFPSEREARAEAKRLKALVRQGKIHTRTDTPTCGALLGAYLKAIDGKPSAKNVRATIEHLKPIATTMCGELEAPVLEDLIGKVSATAGPHAAKKALDHLRTAIRRKFPDGPNVARRVKAPRAPKRKHRVLTAAEARALLPFISDVHRDFYALALHSGLRPSELGAARVADVDLGEGALYVRRSFTRDIPKDGDERRVVLSTEALTIVRRLIKDATGGHLWPELVRRIARDTGLSIPLHRAIRRAVAAGAVPSLSRGWAMKCRRKGCGYVGHADKKPGDERCPTCKFTLWPVPQIVKVRWYDLRHTSATLLIEAGVDAAVVSELLGHHDPRFTMDNYVHLSTAALRKATSKITLKGKR
jgi:integrase